MRRVNKKARRKFEIRYENEDLGDCSFPAVFNLIEKTLQTLLILRNFCDGFQKKNQPDTNSSLRYF